MNAPWFKKNELHEKNVLDRKAPKNYGGLCTCPMCPWGKMSMVEYRTRQIIIITQIGEFFENNGLKEIELINDYPEIR